MTDLKLSPNFWLSEFACHCGCGGERDTRIANNLRRLAFVLEGLRADCGGHKVTITSGYRCPKHNAAVGGEDGSKHMANGNEAAADVQVEGFTPEQAHAKAAARKDVGGLGLYPPTAKRKGWIHVDTRPARATWVG